MTIDAPLKSSCAGEPARFNRKGAAATPHSSALGTDLAVGETVNLLHPPLPLVGVSIGLNRGCH